MAILLETNGLLQYTEFPAKSNRKKLQKTSRKAFPEQRRSPGSGIPFEHIGRLRKILRVERRPKMAYTGQ
jgi:hypothetical protein